MSVHSSRCLLQQHTTHHYYRILVHFNLVFTCLVHKPSFIIVLHIYMIHIVQDKRINSNMYKLPSRRPVVATTTEGYYRDGRTPNGTEPYGNDGIGTQNENYSDGTTTTGTIATYYHCHHDDPPTTSDGSASGSHTIGTRGPATYFPTKQHVRTTNCTTKIGSPRHLKEWLVTEMEICTARVKAVDNEIVFPSIQLGEIWSKIGMVRHNR
jgi:hypothetical protein